MLALAHIVLAVGLVGHGLICIAVVNRLHGLPLRRPWFKLIESPVVAAAISAPLAYLWLVGSGQVSLWVLRSERAWCEPVGLALLYDAAASLVLLVCLPRWLGDRMRPVPEAVQLDAGRRIDLAARLGGRPTGDPATAWLVAIPGNEVFQLEVREKQLRLPRLPQVLDGLRIAHVSDVHMSGRIGIEYFEAVVDEALASRPDVVLATGDYFDRVPCLDWLPRTLGRLTAPLGVYFVMGNHDQRLPDVDLARRRLCDLGWVDLGGRTIQANWRGASVWLAGNELPWFGPAPAVATEVPIGAPPHGVAVGLRIALLHTPDQVAWARRWGADLALAGHTHGGQVRLPWIGAVFAPSLYGVKYTQSVYQEGSTLLHVSRGISGLEPLRWRCPPELALLTLRSTPTS